MGCIGFLEGYCKYGRNNYRVLGVRASVYYDAAKRHLDAWFDGEDLSPEGIPHLANLLACVAIIVDAQAAGKLNDDRNVKGGYRNLISYLTPFVAELKEKYKDKNPKHYSINDNEKEK